MADQNTGAGLPGSADASADTRPQIGVLAQYIRDLSFENPGAPKSLQTTSEQPKMRVEVNVNARPIEKNIFESQLQVIASAQMQAGTLYHLEFIYAGAFQLANIPDDALRPVLLIQCPALLFPFARRLAADLTREGGFPPLLIDPIDFTSLYQRNLAKAAAQQPANPTNGSA
ncbi:MAG: protein-export chaperone SecB [Rhizobiales bacterium]|nr:protein-export chaperone SecB [Hyphomicrobiales bacterium]